MTNPSTQLLRLSLTVLCGGWWRVEGFRSLDNHGILAAARSLTRTRTHTHTHSSSTTARSVLFQPEQEECTNFDPNPAPTNDYGANYMPLDDTPLEITCDPHFPTVDAEGVEQACVRQGTWLERYGESLAVFGVPGLTPFVAFNSFDQVAAAFHWIAQELSSNNWVSVDGGAYQAKIIAPAINGVVVPSVALLLATLTSTTITTLRQRQLDVRTCINLEAAELRAMECLLDALEPSPVQEQCRDYVSQCENL